MTKLVSSSEGLKSNNNYEHQLAAVYKRSMGAVSRLFRRNTLAILSFLRIYPVMKPVTGGQPMVASSVPIMKFYQPAVACSCDVHW